MPHRERSITDYEVSLIKAMLNRGMRNDSIHFYFNKENRLISSGRIAQIKSGNYGANIRCATEAELENFFSERENSSKLALLEKTSSYVEHSTIKSLFRKNGLSWRLILGETDRVECKKTFRLSPEVRFSDPLRSIAGLANNKGGYIFFGVDYTTLTAIGLLDNSFDETDPSVINRTITGALDPAPHFTKTVITIGSCKIGVLYIEANENAPVIALKNIGSDIKEGTIYYRYVGETKAIKPGELRQIIGRREQRAVSEFSRRMMRVASGAEATINLETGGVKGLAGSFLIDEKILPQIQFFREGDFSEAKGAPALRLVGDVRPIAKKEEEKIRVIRDNITPDAVVRNFLRKEIVADPIQYIHAQIHFQRRWLPIWHYVISAKLGIDTIVEDLRTQLASHPASRDAAVRRLLKIESAYKSAVGKSLQIRDSLIAGNAKPPTTTEEDVVFANAVTGLLTPTPDMDKIALIILEALDRTVADDVKTRARRSLMYRAACRLDELMNL